MGTGRARTDGMVRAAESHSWGSWVRSKRCVSPQGSAGVGWFPSSLQIFALATGDQLVANPSQSLLEKQSILFMSVGSYSFAIFWSLYERLQFCGCVVGCC